MRYCAIELDMNMFQYRKHDAFEKNYPPESIEAGMVGSIRKLTSCCSSPSRLYKGNKQTSTVGRVCFIYGTTKTLIFYIDMVYHLSCA